MSQRRIQVIHALPTRERKGVREFLLFPHARWQVGASSPFLALPTKQVRPAGNGPAATLGILLSEEMGLAPADLPPLLGSVSLNLRSPALGVPTAYSVLPVMVPVPLREQAALQQRLGGEWMLPEEALRRVLLSPTARRVLEQVAPEAARSLSRGEAANVHLLAAQAGDLELFARLFESYRPMLIDRLRRATETSGLFRVEQDVEDTLSEAAGRILAHLDSFDATRGTAEAWVWTITYRCGVTILRRRTRHRAESLLNFDTGEESIAGPAGDPAEEIATRDDARLVRTELAEVLASEDPAAQEAWRLRFEEDRSYQEIAEELDRPLGTVATLIHRIRKQVRRRVEERGR
jgi:RNA polymerase sigma-70 factor (ECF subfamily)